MSVTEKEILLKGKDKLLPPFLYFGLCSHYVGSRLLQTNAAELLKLARVQRWNISMAFFNLAVSVWWEEKEREHYTIKSKLG